MALAFVYAGEDTAARIEAVPDKGNTVLSLDALDEDPLAWQDLDRCLDRLSAPGFFRKVFISSRVQFFGNREEEWQHLKGRIDLSIVELREFQESQARTYLERNTRISPTCAPKP
ncbi:MAG: hypothetical protein IPJ40_10505, partial [Saprospirales bacterium]|nr:hypothetical protein [Saprospirales bacterium]